MSDHDPYTPPTRPPEFPPLPQLGAPGRLGDDVGIRLLLPVGRSGLAIAAGYLGLISLVILPAPVSLIVSILAIRDIRRSKQTGQVKYGMGRAIFGLVMGIIGTLILAGGFITLALE